MLLAYHYGEIILSYLPYLKTPKLIPFSKQWAWHLVTFHFEKYVLHQNDENIILIGNYGLMNTVSARIWYIDLNSLSRFRLKCKIECVSWKLLDKIFSLSPRAYPTNTSPRPKMPFGGDISFTYLYNIYKGELGSKRETYSYNKIKFP